VARRPNPADRRSTLIEPTEAGRSAVERVGAAFAALEARLPRTGVAEVPAAVDDALSRAR
jgi:DNA-binding MarR family transcriptional regulator